MQTGREALSRFRSSVIAAVAMWLVMGLKVDPTKIISKQFPFPQPL